MDQPQAPSGHHAKWIAVACLCGLLAQPAAAQTQDTTSPIPAADQPAVQDGPLANASTPGLGDGLWKPRQSSHHVGLSVGTARFNMPCLDGMVCKRNGKAITLYAGGDLSQRWGFELAYMRMSNMERDGNALRVKGLNVSLIGELPLVSRVSLIGRVGTNYAWTRMDQATSLGQTTNSARGFGVSYGAGLNLDIAQGWSASADLNRHNVKFVTGRDSVDTATVSLRYRY
jgi:hypothetical protein